MTVTVLKPHPQFTYRVAGAPEHAAETVVVTFTKPVWRRSTGPIARKFEVNDPHTCTREEADALIDAGVATLQSLPQEAA